MKKRVAANLLLELGPEALVAPVQRVEIAHPIRGWGLGLGGLGRYGAGLGFRVRG